MKVYDVLYFIISRTRRRYQRRRERADGVLLLRRGAPDEIYGALYFNNKQNAEKVPETKKEGRRRTSQYVEALLMKYTVIYPRSETRSERVWINCAAILTAISAGVSLPMSIPMGVITRASCCSL